jgi:hypothetical protein
VNLQTDDLHLLDLRYTDIYLAEVYHYDRISKSLKKFVIEKGSDFEVIKQYDYNRKVDQVRKYPV